MEGRKTPKIHNKLCLVPSCGNTSNTCPTKVFIQVPKEENSRNLWMDAIGCKAFSRLSTVFVCGDHFNLENDMQNYMHWKLMGGRKLMKRHVVPHKNLEAGNRKRGYVSLEEDIPLKHCKITETVHTGNTENKENILLEIDAKLDLLSTSSTLSCSIHDISLGVTAKPHCQNKEVQVSVAVTTRGCSPIFFYSEDIIREVPVVVVPSRSGTNKQQVTISPSDLTLYSASKNG